MLLELNDVTFSYKRNYPTLRNVTFKINQGEFVGILGPNGTGKSTLLKCINRIHKINSGQILIDGENIYKLSLNAIARKIAYVPQYINAGFPVSVMNTVLMGRIPYSGRSFNKKDKEAAFLALKRVGLDHYILRDIRFLSGGERQRVFVARALAGRPEMILMDEPTSSLDVKHQVEVLNIARNLVKESKISIVMTIHDLNLASLFCSRILIIKEGVLWKDGKPQDILNPDNARAVYGVNTFTFDRFGVRYINLLDNK